jgi:hypothetical protein
MSAPQNDGGPAFPFGQVSEVTGAVINGYHNDGMSLRDYFAAAALQGMMANPECNAMAGQDVARNCYRLSEEMLAARKEGA